jgi:hypothetical protein
VTVRHHDLGLLDHLARELLEREFDDLDVVGDGVGARVAGPQHARQRLRALVEVGQQRMKAEAALEGAGGAVFVGVGADQRRVKIDHDALGRRASIPSVLSRLAARRAQRVQSTGSRAIASITRNAVASTTAPNSGRWSRTARRSAKQSPPSASIRQIGHHPTRSVPAAPLAHRHQRPRQRCGQPQPIGRLGQQRRAGGATPTRVRPVELLR